MTRSVTVLSKTSKFQCLLYALSVYFKLLLLFYSQFHKCELDMLFLYILPTLHTVGTVVLAGILTLDDNTCALNSVITCNTTVFWDVTQHTL